MNQYQIIVTELVTSKGIVEAESETDAINGVVSGRLLLSSCNEKLEKIEALEIIDLEVEDEQVDSETMLELANSVDAIFDSTSG